MVNHPRIEKRVDEDTHQRNGHEIKKTFLVCLRALTNPARKISRGGVEKGRKGEVSEERTL